MNFSRILLLLALILLTVTTASADVNQFAGKWKNVDPRTGGITTIQIDVSSSGIKIQTWGACRPSDCVWGLADGTAYAPSVNSNLEATADTISTIYLFRSSQKILILHLTEEDQMRVELLTKFIDQSRRANTRHVELFKRTEDTGSNR